MTATPRAIFLILMALYMMSFATPTSREWKPTASPLTTRWTAQVSPTNALPEYPRPQMVRPKWQSLNGLWQFSAAMPGDETPIGHQLEQQVLAPYPIESSLSGIGEHLDQVWYRRTFEIPADWAGQNVLLHFDAVNFESVVYLNGTKLGAHKGGYDAFGFNITRLLNKEGPNEVIVGVTHRPDETNHPRGKQTRDAHGIFYTPATGIWQSVWIEPVGKAFIENLHAEPDIDHETVTLTGRAIGDDKAICRAEALDQGQSVVAAEGSLKEGIVLKIKAPKLWSPQSPFLYDLRVTLRHKGADADTVESYFGMRKIALGKDADGITRPMLNNQFVFQVGPLDQGYWPDGIYTAPTDEALRSDIEMTRRLGFNMTRKHVKVEPERWYYWADKLGLLVWQDMPSMREKPGGEAVEQLERDQKNKPLPLEEYQTRRAALVKARDEKATVQKEQFEKELDRMIQGRRNHPSIIVWVVFNEAWGQYDTERLTEHVKTLDPSRLVNNASGWTDQKVGDLIDIHHYPDPAMPDPEPHRAAVLGEFGGISFVVHDHLWIDKSWGYRGVKNSEALTRAYERLMAKAWRLKPQGLSAAIYTQLTDVETEANGLLTYDRKVVKPDPDRVAAVNTGHTDGIPEAVAILNTSAEHWMYTLHQPPDDWMQPGFDDSTWEEGKGGFGTAGTSGSSIGTNWDTDDIWIRREVDLGDKPLQNPQLMLHHDESAEVYLNGVLAVKEATALTEYNETPIDPKAVAALKPGKNVIAAHCRGGHGGKFIDVGITDLQSPPKGAH